MQVAVPSGYLPFEKLFEGERIKLLIQPKFVCLCYFIKWAALQFSCIGGKSEFVSTFVFLLNPKSSVHLLSNMVKDNIFS